MAIRISPAHAKLVIFWGKIVVFITVAMGLKTEAVEVIQLVIDAKHIDLAASLIESVNLYLMYICMLAVYLLYGVVAYLATYAAYQKYWGKKKYEWEMVPEDKFTLNLANITLEIACFTFDCWMTLASLLYLFSEPHFLMILEDVKSLPYIGWILYDVKEVSFILWGVMVLWSYYRWSIYRLGRVCYKYKEENNEKFEFDL